MPRSGEESAVEGSPPGTVRAGMTAYGYGVKLVRGPFVKLPPHAGHLASLADVVAERERFSRPIAVDLFCGAGGLSLGLQDAGFDVVLGVDHDEDALQTHAHLFGGASVNLDLGDPAVVADLAQAVAQLRPRLIAGGPPCQPFSRAGMSKIRSLVAVGQRDATDDRRNLWQAFLEIVLTARPPAVLLENVPDMALGGRMEIIRTIVDELERAGYSVQSRLLHAWEQGVPQHRQRLFVVAVEAGREFRWPNRSSEVVTVSEAISDLPEVKGGDRPDGGADGWWDWERPERPSRFAARARRNLRGAERYRVRDHITRPVRPDDRAAFELMGPRTLYADLPRDLKRYRDDIFDDKYKRLDPDEPSRSITAHIARDGYWYIHPTQPRTLTVREAARLQTFPDNVRFAGPPSSAFRQIGNAVPPRLGEAVGRRLLNLKGPPGYAAASSVDTGRALVAWFDGLGSLQLPWTSPPSSWTVVLASRLLARRPEADQREFWEVISKLVDPQTTDDNSERLIDVGIEVSRLSGARSLLKSARWLVGSGWSPEDDDEIGLAQAPGVSRDLATLAVGLSPGPGPGPMPVTGPLLRLVRRFTGRPVDEERPRSDGRLEIARLIGGTTLRGIEDAHDSRRALGAAVELAARLCTPVGPDCEACPLARWCHHGARR